MVNTSNLTLILFYFILPFPLWSASDDVALQTKFLVFATCGDTVLLTCNATTPQPWNIEIKKFLWEFETNKTCEYKQNHTESEFGCGSTNTTFSRTITLTLRNVMPADDRKYFCKLHSTKGSWNNGSQLRVQGEDLFKWAFRPLEAAFCGKKTPKRFISNKFLIFTGCLGNNKTSRNVSHAECLFEGVYPSGVVHWFQGNKNLTDVANLTETKDELNRFNIRSAIKLKEGNRSESYNCSLWMPSLGRYLSTLQNQKDSGCLIKLQWICVVVMVMMNLVT